MNATPACAGSWDIFDAIIDRPHHAGRYAHLAAAKHCTHCPLAAACLTDPSHADWAPVVLRALIRRSQRGGKAA